MQIQMLTWKIEETSYSFHWMVELEVIKTKNTFMKVELLIYQQKVRKNWTKQWELYKAQITKILNNTFTNYRKDEKLLWFWLVGYAQAFLDFVVPPFVPPLVKTMSRTRYGTIDMGGIEEGIETIMEVDSIATKVATQST